MLLSVREGQSRQPTMTMSAIPWPAYIWSHRRHWRTVLQDLFHYRRVRNYHFWLKPYLFDMDACDIGSYRSSCLRALSHATFDSNRFEDVLEKIKGWAEPLQLNELEKILKDIQIVGRPLHQNVWELLIVLCGCQAPHLAPALRFLDNDLTEWSNSSTVPDLVVIKSDQPFVIVFRRLALAYQGKPVYRSLSILGMAATLYIFCSHGRWGCSESVCCTFHMWVDCEFDQLSNCMPQFPNSLGKLSGRLEEHFESS